MARATDILDIARAELGYKEHPAGSNRTKYGAWFGLDGQPWCMMFVQWVFARAGAADLLPARTASCGALMRSAQAAGLWVTGDYRPGDIAIFDFPGNRVVTDHTGIIDTVTAAGVLSIEGNTAIGNDSNGGEVMRRSRALSLIRGAVRPKYDVEEDTDMVDIEALTDDQLIRLAEKMQAALEKRPISAALAAEVERAKALGITDGSGPNKLCTRAQAAAMIVRAINRT